MRPNLTYLILSLTFLSTGPWVFAQDSIRLPADCQMAKRLSVMKTYYSPVAPQGGGEVVEFEREPEKSLYYFQDEHNTAWYTFKIPAEGKLSFDIIPDSVRDDYDFIIFKSNGPNTCADIHSKTLIPVRSCISRNDKGIQSKTGLKADASDEYIHSGPGKSYSKEIDVQRGEQYYLVLDNVYPEGGRHKIKFHYHQKMAFEGAIKNDTSSAPLRAKVTIEDAKTGEVIIETESDPETGLYRIEPDLDFSKKYELIVTAPGYFFESEQINPQKAIKQKGKPIDINLPKLELHKRFTLEGMNFEPNVDILTKASRPKALRLLRFMRNNPTVEIKIEGHTNCAPWGENVKDQPLSEARAKKIFDILTNGGIEDKRLSRIGYGCSRMIRPNATVIDEQRKNMRVEIQVMHY